MKITLSYNLVKWGPVKLLYFSLKQYRNILTRRVDLYCDISSIEGSLMKCRRVWLSKTITWNWRATTLAALYITPFSLNVAVLAITCAKNWGSSAAPRLAQILNIGIQMAFTIQLISREWTKQKQTASEGINMEVKLCLKRGFNMPIYIPSMCVKVRRERQTSIKVVFIVTIHCLKQFARCALVNT